MFVHSGVRAEAGKRGGDPSAPAVPNPRRNPRARGQYNALSRMYEGETEAGSLELEAVERRRAARGRSIATVLDSAGSIFAEKYG